MTTKNWFLMIASIVMIAGCAKNGPTGSSGRSGREEVVVYTALDQEFAQTIFDDFTRKTGIVVRPKYDTESTKTVGLVQTILTERERPRCDLFWNNEILNTLRLEKQGLLRPYKSPAAAAFPDDVKSPAGMWYGFAARAGAGGEHESSCRKRGGRSRSAT